MNSIVEAKQKLGRELRAYDGFVGVGVGDNSEIRLYALTETAKAVQVLRDRWGDSYEGFPVTVVLSSGFQALSAES